VAFNGLILLLRNHDWKLLTHYLWTRPSLKRLWVWIPLLDIEFWSFCGRVSTKAKVAFIYLSTLGVAI